MVMIMNNRTSLIYKIIYMKSFFLGIVTGIVLTIVALFVIGTASENTAGVNAVNYLERPVSYENKTKTSFKVFQVLGNGALANEISDIEFGWYHGNTVLILGENFYTDQVVTIKKPQRVGTYSYTTKNDMPMTVPVIDGDIIE